MAVPTREELFKKFAPEFIKPAIFAFGIIKKNITEIPRSIERIFFLHKNIKSGTNH